MDNYIGNPAAVQSPSSAPGPSVVPVVALSQDGIDDVNYANFAQRSKVAADFIGYIQSILNGQPAYNAAAAAAFSAASLVPQIVMKDQGNNPRWSIDYLGLPLGNRIMQFSESWIGASGVITSGTFTPVPRWQVTTSGSSTGCSVNGPSSTYPTPSVNINCGSSASAYSCLSTQLQVVMPNTNQVTVLEWDASLGVINNAGIWGVAMGFDIAVPFLGTLKGARLVAGSNISGVINGNWWMQNGNGSAAATADTGVATTLNWTRFRLEIHGSGSPYGACARFFVNNPTTPTATYSAADLVPTNGTAELYITFLANSGDTNAARQLLVGGVNCVVNRFATVGV